ncbi:MAG TPA: ImmA/IrrE family metallo-endopeptidase [Candidatus Saccharimonadales bacterium]|nr:ImmA/IrrE family metallo-endopeptidase [Candidatus Saccharimonadales bacterium]
MNGVADWKRVENKAHEILNKFNIKEPLIDVYSIADAEGININPVIPGEDHEFSGFLDSNGEKPVMYVNADESVTRQNWTIAHELGHYYLQHKPDEWGIAWRNQSDKNEFEQEADYFAACLLVPEQMLRSLMRKFKLKAEDSLLLSQMFGVSERAMKNRLNFLRIT